MSALSLLAKAERFLAQGRLADAHGALVRARRAPADPFLRADIFFKNAEALRGLGRFHKALSSYLFAQTLFKKLNIPSERLSALLGASACLRVLGRYAEVRRMWSTFLRTSYWRGRGPVPSEVELERALVARGEGRFLEARSGIMRVLRRESRGQKSDRISLLQHAYWIKGGIARFSGRFPEALESFQQAVRLARRNGDVSSEAYALFGLAGVQRVLGRDKASSANYWGGYRALNKIGDPFGQAYGLCGRANALRAYGDAAKALPLYRLSSSLYKRLGDESSEGFAHWGMGGSLRCLGRHRSALSSYAKALRLFRKSKDDRGLVMTHLGIARLAEDQGNTRGALREAGRSLREARESGLRYEVALARYEIGRIRRPLHPPYEILHSMGIPPSVLRRWRDIP